MFLYLYDVENTSYDLLDGLKVNDLRHKNGVFTVCFLYLITPVLPVKALLSKNY